MNKRFLILGNGIAGLTAAETIRRTLPEAEITMLTDEPEPTYARPLLSKVYLKTLNKERLYVHPPEWYSEHRIDLRLNTRAEAIDPSAHTVTTAAGETLGYDKLIYALGTAPFVPPYDYIPGGVFTVRSLADIYEIHRYTAVAKNIVVIGGGVIGLEIAWELRQMGPAVTVLELASRLMSRQLDTQSAALITQLIESNGVAVRTGVSINGMLGGADGNVTGVEMADGSVFPADLVIISAGLRPRKQLAEAAGLACGRGVLVNDFMQTSDPDIYAVGDCMEGRFMNPALWAYSKASALTAARNACGTEEPKAFEPVFGDILIHGMGTALLSAGYVNEAEEGTTSQLLDEEYEEPLFKINAVDGHERHYEKRFYKNGKLQGAVLIGNLSRMHIVREEIAKAKEG